MKHQFKFRAECLSDFTELLSVTGRMIEAYRIESLLFPDITVEVTLVGSATMDHLRNKMCYIEDSHVMRETLAPIDEYTGERK